MADTHKYIHLKESMKISNPEVYTFTIVFLTLCRSYRLIKGGSPVLYMCFCENTAQIKKVKIKHAFSFFFIQKDHIVRDGKLWSVSLPPWSLLISYNNVCLTKIDLKNKNEEIKG